MYSEKEMVLYVKTNKVGSTCSVPTRLSESEWDELSDEEKAEIENELMWNVLDTWVGAE